MQNKIFSKDSWLVGCFLAAAFTAVIFFTAMEGPVAVNLGLVEPYDEQYATALSSQVAERATEKSNGRAFGPFTAFGPDTEVAKNGQGVFEGELKIFVAEQMSEDGTEITRSDETYYLYDEITDMVVELQPDGKLPSGLMAGDKLRARGTVFNGRMTVAEALGGSQDGSIELLAAGPAALATPETLKFGVILGNFSDRNLTCTAPQVEALMFTNTASVDKAFRSASNDTFGITGEVLGLYTISDSAASSDYSGWGTALQNAAQADGHNLRDYDHLVYVVPPNGTGHSGLAYRGGNAWIFKCGVPFLYEHELGHVIYLGHAQFGSNVYADHSSFMGAPYQLIHANAPHAVFKKWVNTDTILANPASGNYTLSSLDMLAVNASSPQVMTFPTSRGKLNYYVSYRTPTGYAANMKLQYHNKVNVHEWAADSSNTLLRATLGVGQSFTDADSNIKITVNSVSDTSADVLVTSGGSAPEPCAAANPLVAITPDTIGSTPGGSVSYNVSIKNNDSSTCTSKTFGLTVTDSSANLTTSLSGSSVTLAPGGTTNITLTAQSDTAITGSHTITVKAAAGTSVGSDTATYLVDVNAPSVPTNLSASLKRKQVTLSWNASTDASGVAGYNIYRDGSLIGTTVNTNYADQSPNEGTNVYTVQAFDAADNRSAMSASVSVTFSSSGKPGGGSDGGSGKPEKCTPWPSCR